MSEKPLLSGGNVYNDNDGNNENQVPAETPEKGSNIPIGVPTKKKLVSHQASLALFLSMVALAIAIITIAPGTSIPWHLTVTYQLIIVGLMLQIMTRCMNNLLTGSFLILEARFGSSRLQNYTSIITSNILGSKTDIVWRCAFVTMLLVSTGLSAAYKSLLDGRDSSPVKPPSGGTYGIAPPSVGSYSDYQGSIYFYMNAYAQFIADSTDGFSKPPSGIEPVPYGFNVLLLGNDTAATLDLPDPQYLAAMQSSMTAGENWTVSASVGAYVSRFNYTIDRLRDSDEFWAEIWDYSNGRNYGGMTSYWVFAGNASLGMVPEGSASLSSVSSVLGIYPNSRSFWVGVHTTPTDPDAINFRQYAVMIDLVRQNCSAEWSVTTTNITLLSGKCEGALLDSAVLHDPYMAPYNQDSLPVLSPSLKPVDQRAQGLPRSPWFGPAYAAATSTFWWARAAYTTPYVKQAGFRDVFYPPQDEKIISHRPTLKAGWKLYLVIAAQPIICLAAYLAVVTLYTVPVGPAFGLTSLLAGVDAESLRLLEGAGFSGETQKPINVGFRLEDNDSDVPHVRYKLMVASPAQKRVVLKKDQLYG